MVGKNADIVLVILVFFSWLNRTTVRQDYEMKHAALLIFFFVLPGCVSHGVWKAVGSRDSNNDPIGEFRFVTANDQVQAKGAFVHGQMDGIWVFNDSRDSKIAEIEYKDGKPSGKYSTYWSSFSAPAVAGKLQAVGYMKDGLPHGEHVAYNPDGSVWNKALFDSGRVISATVGSVEDADKLIQADLLFIRMLESGVKEALKYRTT